MKQRRRRSAVTGPSVEIEITAIGARGDGIAQLDGKPVFVPFTLPGDRVRVRLGEAQGEGRAARLEALLSAGRGRAAPRCRHFGRCGGCSLQHLDDTAYVAAKLAILDAALKRHGLGDAPVAPLVRIAPGVRRRARLSLTRPAAAAAPAIVGFAERASHVVVDLAECPVLRAPLVALIAPLRALAVKLLQPGESAQALLLEVTSGVDLLLDLPRAPDLAGLETLADFAAAQDLARLEWRASNDALAVPVAQRRAVDLAFGGVRVALPGDAFLQATAEAEQALVAEAVEFLSGATHIADLFAGLGTFAFPLARHARIHAVEGWQPAVSAMRDAARRAGLAGRFSVEARDLAARPLDAAELAPYDAVLLDPPRIGARAQATALAGAAIPRILMVSCNPATFARDARLLVDGGYQLVRIQPVDQFLWSAHLELAASFVR
jgi:23S rRNA (uracil1939-C5)-methyltransferase